MGWAPYLLLNIGLAWKDSSRTNTVAYLPNMNINVNTGTKNNDLQAEARERRNISNGC
jgi:hypothetical protein